MEESRKRWGYQRNVAEYSHLLIPAWVRFSPVDISNHLCGDVLNLYKHTRKYPLGTKKNRIYF